VLTRYCDRRRFIRVPAYGPARWKSAAQSGHCEVVNISAGGVGLRMSARKAARLSTRITVEVEVAPGEKWYVAKNARVARRAPADDGTCIIGIEFARPQVTHPPRAVAVSRSGR
jgi:c-di-GMP-binding flagellar brake protein YcgR